MRSKKVLVLISVLFVVVALTTIFVGCDKKVETELYYNNEVEGRYTDGIKLVKQFDAPADAVEYKDLPRVEKLFYVDDRVKGFHFTGLYIPAGETITITIDSSMISKKHKIVLNSDQPNQKEIDLDSTKEIHKIEEGSRVDIWVDDTASEFNAFRVNISGCVEMPYHRLGVDRKEIVATDGFAVLDCLNVRFIVPGKELDKVYKLDDTLRWYRSAVEIMNRITETSISSGDKSPILVYVGDYSSNSWEAKEKYIKIKRNDFEGLLNYNNLINGKSEVILDLLGELIAQRADGYSIGLLKDDFGKVLSDISYIVMTNNIHSDVKLNNANAYDYLDSIIKKTCTDSKSQMFYNTILHSFGIDKTIEVLKQYKYTMLNVKTVADVESYVVKTSEILDRDMSYFCELLGYNISQETMDATRIYPKFIPVQTKYTISGGTNDDQTGVILPLGQTSRLDFNKAIISPMEGTWEVIDLIGSANWTKVSSGVYDYNPTKELLEDDFDIKLSLNGVEATLHGKVSVNIKVASQRVYQDNSYQKVDNLDKAIKGIKDKEPSESFSVYKAEVVPEDDIQDNVYSLASCNGSMQVKEDGRYTFYLKNKGIVKVKFGVTEYMFDMFYNPLSVNNYTEELKYEIDLESSKIYNFEIYVLSTQGEGSATLGIKNAAGEIVDVDENYIVFQDMHRDAIIEYDAPVFAIDNLDIQQKDFDNHIPRNWNLIEKYETLTNHDEAKMFDMNKTSYFETKDFQNEFVLTLDMRKSYYAEYIQISNKIDMLGKNMKIDISLNGETYENVFEGIIKDSETTVMFKDDAKNCQYVKFTFVSEEAFRCAITELSVGKLMSESVIIPNTSRKISYQGEFIEIDEYASINGSVTINNDKNCAIEYEFYGSMISVYSTKDSQFGTMKVYIDNKEQQNISLYSENGAECATKVYTKEFDKPGLHTIKLVPLGKDDIINIDYLTAVETERPTVEANDFNYWYISIIPAILIIGLICFIIADSVNKKNKNNPKKQEKKAEKKSKKNKKS